MAKQYVRQYRAPSRSTDKLYKVSVTDKGEWECDCPAWKFRSPRRDCHHIKSVKTNPEKFEQIGVPNAKEIYPRIVLANVKEVTRMEDNELYTPLIPLDNPPFIATVMYDLLRHGVPWGEVKERYGKYVAFTGGGVTKDAVIEWVNYHGRTVIEELRSAPMIPSTYTITREGLTLNGKG